MSFQCGDFLAIDTETTGLFRYHGHEPFAVSMCNEDGETWYTEWPVDPYTREVFPNSSDLDFIDSFTSNPSITKVMFNDKFDMGMLETIGLTITGPVEDGSIGIRCYNSSADNNGLKEAAFMYCGIAKDDETELHDAVKLARKICMARGYNLAETYHADYWLPRHLHTRSRRGMFSYLPDEWAEYCEIYARLDARRTMVLWKFLEKAFAADEIVYLDYLNERKLSPIIQKMEARGAAIDPGKNNRELAKAEKLVAECRERMFKIVGRSFNSGSPKQLAELLYKERGLTPTTFTASGQPSTDWKSILKLSADPVCRELLTDRAQSKAISTFFSKYPTLWAEDPLVPPGRTWSEVDKNGDPIYIDHPQGYVIHPNINQCGTTTGRFSMSNPNLQNIANATTNPRGNDPIHARQVFGPRPGYYWLMGDFAQQELRIFADIANVKPLISAILAGEDPNTANANLIWGGKGNESALHAAVQSGEFINVAPSTPAVGEMWEKIGWEYGMGAGGAYSGPVLDAAERWLALYDYKIVAAEGSIGKKMTRNKSKMTIFNEIYGGGTGPLMELMYIDEETARQYKKDLNCRYPEVKQYQQYAMSRATMCGYVVTRYGKKLRADPNRIYAVVNWEVQGSAAGMMKDGMIRCDEYIKDTGLDAHILITIHDELIFEVRKEHCFKWFVRGLKETMEDTGGRFRLPMEVEFSKADVQWDMKEAIHI